MKIFKINISQSFEAFEVHKKITCPVAGHAGYVQMGKIKKGDFIILLVNNLVHCCAIAQSDCFIGNVSYYDTTPEFTTNDLFTIDVKPIETLSLNMNTDVLKELFKGNPFYSKNFCLECYPLIEKDHSIFIQKLNKVVFGSDTDLKMVVNEN